MTSYTPTEQVTRDLATTTVDSVQYMHERYGLQAPMCGDTLAKLRTEA